jgi:YVTN family beta-propeller protein
VTWRDRVTCRAWFAAATLAIACTYAAWAQTPLTLVDTIELPGVDGRIDHLAVDVGARQLYVAALGNNTVEVLDLKNRRVKTVPGFREPQGIAVAAEARELG